MNEGVKVVTTHSNLKNLDHSFLNYKNYSFLCKITKNVYTVKVMIMSRYRYRPVTIPLPLQRYRDSPSGTVTALP